MMLNAVKKSTNSSAIRWSKLSSGVATTNRSFLSSSKQIGQVHHRSIYSAANQSIGGKGYTNQQLVRMTSSIINTNYYYDATGIAASAIAGGGAGRFPIGNPSTMAFLGIRSKSSGAAFSHSIEDDDVSYDTTTASANGGGVGRSHQEAWMVNLDRGDNEWLCRPRTSDWYTGLEPSICPGKFYMFIVVVAILKLFTTVFTDSNFCLMNCIVMIAQINCCLENFPTLMTRKSIFFIAHF